MASSIWAITSSTSTVSLSCGSVGEFDVPPPNPEKLKLYAPVAMKGGEHIEGLVRSEWTGDERVDTIALGDRNQIGYPVANRSDPSNQLLVRDHPEGDRRTIPRAEWSFKDERHVTLNGGFRPRQNL